MKRVYRGFDIDVSRAKCMAGYPLLYFNVYRKSDGWEFICNFTEGVDTVWDYVGYMKERIDGFILKPEDDELQRDHETHEKYAQRIEEHKKENEKTQRLYGES